MEFEICKHGLFHYDVNIRMHENEPWTYCGVCRTLHGAKKLVKMIGKVLMSSAKKQNQSTN